MAHQAETAHKIPPSFTDHTFVHVYYDKCDVLHHLLLRGELKATSGGHMIETDMEPELNQLATSPHGVGDTCSSSLWAVLSNHCFALSHLLSNYLWVARATLVEGMVNPMEVSVGLQAC